MVLALRPDAAVRRSVESVTPFERRRLEAHSILSELLGFVRREVDDVSQPLQVLPKCHGEFGRGISVPDCPRWPSKL